MVGDEDDGTLVRLCAAGGPDARAAEALLCRRFAPRIRLYGLRHLHDEDRARELTQMVLLAVIEAARGGRIRELGAVDHFVLGTCRNLTLKLRAQASRAVAELPELAVPPVDVVDPLALIRCFGGLDARAQEVLLLSFHAEKSSDEIAGALHTSAGNVRVLRHRALAALRECLES
jgi:RNA polymerase sigma-70 factor, ECF subfamily